MGGHAWLLAQIVNLHATCLAICFVHERAGRIIYLRLHARPVSMNTIIARTLMEYNILL